MVRGSGLSLVAPERGSGLSLVAPERGRRGSCPPLEGWVSSEARRKGCHTNSERHPLSRSLLSRQLPLKGEPRETPLSRLRLDISPKRGDEVPASFSRGRGRGGGYYILVAHLIPRHNF